MTSQQTHFTTKKEKCQVFSHLIYKASPNEHLRILATAEFLEVLLYAVKLVYALDIEFILRGNEACLDLLLHLRLRLVKAALRYVADCGGFGGSSSMEYRRSAESDPIERVTPSFFATSLDKTSFISGISLTFCKKSATLIVR